jgi:hypothetical protein
MPCTQRSLPTTDHGSLPNLAVLEKYKYGITAFRTNVPSRSPFRFAWHHLTFDEWPKG